MGNSDFVDWLLIAYVGAEDTFWWERTPWYTGKNRLSAKVLAEALSRKSKRIQFYDGYAPFGYSGAYLYDPAELIILNFCRDRFTDFLIADEINQNAPTHSIRSSTEGMEGAPSHDEGTEHRLSDDFFVMATQNPQDFEGTFPLPEVEMDRFLFKLVDASRGPRNGNHALPARPFRTPSPSIFKYFAGGV